MSSHLHLQLARITSLYERLVSMLPPDRWGEVKQVSSALRETIKRDAYEITRMVDGIREMIDKRILVEDIDLHSSQKAKIFFDEILPRSDLLDSLWMEASGLAELNLDDLLDLTDQKEGPVKGDGQLRQEVAQWKTVWIDSIDSLISWAVERTDGFLEDGGYGDSEIVVPNETYNRAVRLIRAKFFEPDTWYENLQRINPVLANPKKLPRDVRFRVGEIHRSLIVGNYLSAVILCRSVLEYCLAKESKARTISAMWPSGKLTGC